MIAHRQNGFTLVEIAIVLLIVGLLLGGLLVPLSAQMDQQRYSETQKQMQQIQEALLGFAVSNQRLPCPALPSSAGIEQPPGGGPCTVQHGFVPSVTLGIAGSLNQDGLLIDSWGNPIRYSVATTNNSAITTIGQMRVVTMPTLQVNLVAPTPAGGLKVCSTSVSSTPNSCDIGPPSRVLTNNAVAVLFSMGKDSSSVLSPATASPDEFANVDAPLLLGGGPSGLSYRVPVNNVFVSHEMNLTPGSTFDDIVTWLSPTILFNRMVMAGQLP